jgi:hypothetical protein
VSGSLIRRWAQVTLVAQVAFVVGFLIAAAFVLSSALRRTPGWQDWAGQARWVGVVFIALLVADVATSSLRIGGLLERLLAIFGAAAIGALAWRISRSSEPRRVV